MWMLWGHSEGEEESRGGPQETILGGWREISIFLSGCSRTMDWCPRIWATSLTEAGDRHVPFSVSVEPPAMLSAYQVIPATMCSFGPALLRAFAFICCDPWTLKTVLLGVPHLFTLSSLNLLRPQAVPNTEQTLFHRNEFILLTHTLRFWRMVIAIYIMIWVYNKLYFRLLLIQRGNPNEVWWIEMEVKWIKNFPKNHSLAQFGINIMTSAFLWFVFVSPLTYRFSEISF